MRELKAETNDFKICDMTSQIKGFALQYASFYRTAAGAHGLFFFFLLEGLVLPQHMSCSTSQS